MANARGDVRRLKCRVAVSIVALWCVYRGNDALSYSVSKAQ